ncbi:baeRF8 domain-containing protein [Rubneribacter sp.]
MPDMPAGVTFLTDPAPALLAREKPPCASIYLPTGGPREERRDRALFEALANEAREKIERQSERRERGRLDELLDLASARLGALRSGLAESGLAVLAASDRAYACRLDRPVGPLAFTGERFLTRPLLGALRPGARYLLLALSADRFSLIEGDARSLERMEVPAPARDARRTASGGPSFDGHQSAYHGWKSSNDVRKEEAEAFFRSVNQEATALLSRDGGPRLPVILVSLPEHQGMFRRISTVPGLLEEGIEKNPDGVGEPELLADAAAVMGRVAQAHAERLLDAYGQAVGTGGASSSPYAVGMALAERKVRALLLAEGAYVPGAFDERTGEVRLFERRPHDRFQGPELADALSRAALAQGAEVLELPAEQVPGESGIAALFRY